MYTKEYNRYEPKALFEQSLRKLATVNNFQGAPPLGAKLIHDRPTKFQTAYKAQLRPMAMQSLHTHKRQTKDASPISHRIELPEARKENEEAIVRRRLARYKCHQGGISIQMPVASRECLSLHPNHADHSWAKISTQIS